MSKIKASTTLGNLIAKYANCSGAEIKNLLIELQQIANALNADSDRLAEVEAVLDTRTTEHSKMFMKLERIEAHLQLMAKYPGHPHFSAQILIDREFPKENTDDKQ